MTTRLARLTSVILGTVLVTATIAACGSDDEAVAAADLAGRTFTTDEIDGAEIVSGSTISITFVDETSISVQAGCNTMNGGYSIADGKLVVGALAMTMMACEEALMAQDQLLSGFLSSSPSIELDGDELDLEQGDISLSLDAA